MLSAVVVIGALRVKIMFTDFVNDMEEMMLNTFYNKSKINTTAALEEAKQILEEIKSRDFNGKEEEAFEESR